MFQSWSDWNPADCQSPIIYILLIYLMHWEGMALWLSLTLVFTESHNTISASNFGSYLTRHFTLPKHFSFLSQMMTYLPHIFLDQVTPAPQPDKTQERHIETTLNFVLMIRIPSSNVPALRSVKILIKRNLN